MNDFPDPGSTPATTENAIEPLQAAYRSLRAQFHALLALLILLTGSLGIYLYCQVVLVQRQIEDQQRLLADYQQNSKPLINDFLNKMQAFAKGNAEFAQVFAKYVRPADSSAPTVPTKK
ncbi:MAG: hypothetical protein HY043_19040 [Verrucomicrobia bacterium]|nr:hypothetical protein [Verrucomicrobiota bacterium]